MSTTQAIWNAIKMAGMALAVSAVLAAGIFSIAFYACSRMMFR